MVKINPELEFNFPTKGDVEAQWEKGKSSWEFQGSPGVRIIESKVAQVHDEVLEELDQGLEEVARRILEQFKFNIRNEAYAFGELLLGAGMRKVDFLDYEVYNDCPHFIWIEFGREPSDRYSWEMFENVKDWVQKVGVRMVYKYRDEARFKHWGRERIGEPNPKMYRRWRTTSAIKGIDQMIKAKRTEINRTRNATAQRKLSAELKQFRDQRSKMATTSREERELNDATWRIMKSLGSRSWNREGMHLLERAVETVSPEADEIIAGYIT